MLKTILEFLWRSYDNTFLHALGNEVGQSLYEKKMVKTARDIISIYGVR